MKYQAIVIWLYLTTWVGVSVSSIRSSCFLSLSSFERQKLFELFLLGQSMFKTGLSVLLSLAGVFREAAGWTKEVFLWVHRAADPTEGTVPHCSCKALSWLLSSLLSNSVCSPSGYQEQKDMCVYMCMCGRKQEVNLLLNIKNNKYNQVVVTSQTSEITKIKSQ